MKKKSLSVKKKNHNLVLKHLNDKTILEVYKEFEKSIDFKRRYAVAVSGGPDSLALAYFCKCISVIHKTKIKFYLVDHKLRNDSTQEAEKVLKILKKKKIKCKILTWKGKKPNSNIQSVARENRYNLLFNECKRSKIEFLLLGHHIDDLYENFLIRLLRGSGLKGLVSLDKISQSNSKGLDVVRPLLGVKKHDLQKVSIKVFNFFVDDPSNINQNFKRIRIRGLINTLEKEGLDKNKLNLTLKNLRHANNAINFYTKNNIKKNSIYFKERNTFILNRSFFSQPNEIIFRSFGNILKKIGKKYYHPRGKSLVSVIQRIKSKKLKKTTLGGCMIKKVSETVIVFPETSKKRLN